MAQQLRPAGLQSPRIAQQSRSAGLQSPLVPTKPPGKENQSPQRPNKRPRADPADAPVADMAPKKLVAEAATKTFVAAADIASSTSLSSFVDVVNPWG
jgi:hypothetical protein